MDYQEELLEPIKYFNYELKHKHLDKVNAFFDKLEQKSNVDIEGNRLTCREYYTLENKANQLEKKLGANKGLRGFLIAMTILGFVVGTILIFVSFFKKDLLPILLPIGIVLILLGVGFIILNSIVVAKKIQQYGEMINKIRKEAEEKKRLAYEQMAPLNALYDWSIPAQLVTETTPIIQMDKNLSVTRCAHLVQNYGWKDTNSDNVSTIFIQSGTIIGNPFLYERDYIQTMRNETYTGTLVISWTTTVSDGKGGTRIVTHTQTLVAHVTRPAAHFFLDTALIYGNEAAPKLSFSRRNSGANSMSAKEIEKNSENFGKTLQKKQEKDINKSFTPLGNNKFEYLFNALDRDNEVEFRLLFTPLAQKNMIDVITSKTPYGDDFSFTKKKMINVIQSAHGQVLSFDGNPYHFIDFDHDRARERFVSYNTEYFQGIFYDFVPLLSIPLYQQQRDYDPKQKPNYQGTVTLYEAEVLANFMDDDIFKPEECDTNVILKATLDASYNGVNIFNIHSYGFKKIPMLEVVPTLGGDGRMHGVPVHYFEYERVDKDSKTVAIEVGGNAQLFAQNKDKLLELISKYSTSSDIIYQRGLLSFPLQEGISTINGEEIKKLFDLKED